ncbi:ubiquitin domain protein, putative, partial [Trichophyton verrucosum HKI 0517]
GCCFSRDADSSPYPGSTAGQHGDSSHQINVNTAGHRHDQTERPSLNGGLSHAASDASSATPRPHRSAARRGVPLNEHFNQPIRPHVWKSKRRTWTRATIDREREVFFDTRVAGRPEIWAALSTALSLLREGDVQTAQGIIDAAGITIPTGDVCEGCYDESGALYKFPEVIVSDPVNLADDDDAAEEAFKCDTGADLDGDADGDTAGDETSTAKLVLGTGSSDDLLDKEKERRREEKGKRNERDLLKVTARLSDRGGPDVVVSIGKEQTVAALVRRIQAEARVRCRFDISLTTTTMMMMIEKLSITANCSSQLPSNTRIQIVYLGKFFRDSQTLLEQGWKEGNVVNAYVRVSK